MSLFKTIIANGIAINGSVFASTLGSVAITVNPFQSKHIFLNEVSISTAYHF